MPAQKKSGNLLNVIGITLIDQGNGIGDPNLNSEQGYSCFIPLEKVWIYLPSSSQPIYATIEEQIEFFSLG